jgi:DNA invertase Pin-like site-specific DNA recombinase
MSSPATLVKKAAARKNRLAVGRRVIMASFDKKAGNTIRANQRKKAKAAKKQGQTNTNLGQQWDTPLSRMYDNDGNPKKPEVQWNTPGPFVGH